MLNQYGQPTQTRQDLKRIQKISPNRRKLSNDNSQQPFTKTSKEKVHANETHMRHTQNRTDATKNCLQNTTNIYTHIRSTKSKNYSQNTMTWES